MTHHDPSNELLSPPRQFIILSTVVAWLLGAPTVELVKMAFAKEIERDHAQAILMCLAGSGPLVAATLIITVIFMKQAIQGYSFMCAAVFILWAAAYAANLLAYAGFGPEVSLPDTHGAAPQLAAAQLGAFFDAYGFSPALAGVLVGVWGGYRLAPLQKNSSQPVGGPGA